jgi:hypothetical protein
MAEWAPPINQMSREDLNNAECLYCFNPLFIPSADKPEPHPCEITRCRHRLHRSCLEEWCSNQPNTLENCRCPICQRPFNYNTELQDLTQQVTDRIAELNAPPQQQEEPEHEPEHHHEQEADIDGLRQQLLDAANVAYQSVMAARDSTRRQSGENVRIMHTALQQAQILTNIAGRIMEAHREEIEELSQEILSIALDVNRSTSGNILRHAENNNVRHSLETAQEASFQTARVASELIVALLPREEEHVPEVEPMQQVVIHDPEIREIVTQLADIFEKNTRNMTGEGFYTRDLRLLHPNRMRHYEGEYGIRSLNDLYNRNKRIIEEYMFERIQDYIQQIIRSQHNYHTLQVPLEINVTAIYHVKSVIDSYRREKTQNSIIGIQEIIHNMEESYRRAEATDRTIQQGPIMERNMYSDPNVRRFWNTCWKPFVHIGYSRITGMFFTMFNDMTPDRNDAPPYNDMPRYFELILRLLRRIQFLFHEHGLRGAGKKKRINRRFRHRTVKKRRTNTKKHRKTMIRRKNVK